MNGASSAVGKRCRISTTYRDREGEILEYSPELDAFTVDIGEELPLMFGVSVVQVLPNAEPH